MPTVIPVTELSNYTEVLSQVDDTRQVYLSENGRRVYMITKIDPENEMAQETALEQLISDLKRCEDRANREGWIAEDVFDREMEMLD